MDADIYDAGYVERLFDEMAGTYERVNYLSSFGFSLRWRAQFVRQAGIRPGAAVCDLMCGMGECWGFVAVALGSGGRILALDLSSQMLRGARARVARFPHLSIRVAKENALETSLPDASADAVVCGFGLKTLAQAQQAGLAAEIRRVLRPGGTFSLVEVSVPESPLLRGLYMFYLERVIPVVGRLLLGNPANYRMLGVYTRRFGDCRGMAEALRRQGLEVRYHRYFFGCASGVSGAKP